MLVRANDVRLIRRGKWATRKSTYRPKIIRFATVVQKKTKIKTNDSSNVQNMTYGYNGATAITTVVYFHYNVCNVYVTRRWPNHGAFYYVEKRLLCWVTIAVRSFSGRRKVFFLFELFFFLGHQQLCFKLKNPSMYYILCFGTIHTIHNQPVHQNVTI